ncbi:MAG TPA: hypothetical protein PLL76_19885 [Thermoanaerobaculia bacterium]|nr:hypothetical protein [Thermoanaerobaculia bacterium]
MDRRFALPAGVNSGTDPEREAIGRLYVEAAQRLGVSVLGITEHNDLTYFPYIRNAAAGTEIVVFPGVELTLPPGIHVIALFEPTVELSVVQDCLVRMGLGTKVESRFHDDGSPKLATTTLRDALALVHEIGGLVIAPHVCGKSGLLEALDGQSRIEAWTDPQVLAADPGCGKLVTALGPFERGAFENTLDKYRRVHPVAPVWTSDARSLEEIGKYSTWIKLGAPTIEGLRQAFLDPESRIRHPQLYVGTSYPRLISVSWDGAGFLASQEIRFNENLNCLIGGKGAGKSAVIESLRFALDIAPPKDFKEQTRGLLDAVIPAGTTVRVALESAEPKARYTVERLKGGYAAQVRDASGAILADVRPVHLQLPSVYGQKEIYAIAQKGSDQLAVLDGFVGSDIETLNAEEREHRKDLERNAEALEHLYVDVEGYEERLRELPKLQEMKKRYESLGIATKLAEKTGLDASHKKLRRAQAKLVTFADALKQPPTTRLASEYGELPVTTPLKSSLDEARALIESTANDFRVQIDGVARTAAARAERVGQLVTEASAAIAREESTFKRTLAALTTEYPDVALDDYLRLEEQISELLPLKKEREERASGEKALRAKRTALLDKLRRTRTDRFKRRQETAQRLNESLNGILRIAVVFEGNRDTVRTYLEGLKAGIQRKTIDSLIAHPDFSLPALVAALAGGADRLVELFDVSEAVARKLVSALDARERFILETYDLPDAISIEFNVGPPGTPQYKPLKHLSVGQKSTAILLLLLLNDNHPFVVDQPEDDLDNRFIYEDIVRRLRDSKEQRQFVIATHNANIPVLGDAEQIVVLNATSDTTKVECAGSIDDLQVQQSVKHILEGGRQAFELRRKKYGF